MKKVETLMLMAGLVFSVMLFGCSQNDGDSSSQNSDDTIADNGTSENNGTDNTGTGNTSGNAGDQGNTSNNAEGVVEDPSITLVAGKHWFLDNKDNLDITKISKIFIQTESLSMEMPYKWSVASDGSDYYTAHANYAQDTVWICGNGHKLIANADMSGMFGETFVRYIKGFENIDTKNATTMSEMFSDTEIDYVNLSNINTSKVTNFYGMFKLSSFTKDCDFSKFDTSAGVDFGSMFYASSFTKLDLSSFDTRKGKDFNLMFENMEDLVTIYATENFVVETNKIQEMFKGSENLTGGNGTKYDSSTLNGFDDSHYARIDTAETPGLFTLKSN